MLQEPTFTKATRTRRIAGFLIDHLSISFVFVYIIFQIIGPDLMDEMNADKFQQIIVLVMVPVFFLYFAKDSIKGISLGKWIVGIMVRDAADLNQVPSFGRLYLRNLFIIIWPVEFLALVINKDKRRLGDTVTNSRVVENPEKSPRLHRILGLIALFAAIIIFVFSFTTSAIKSSEAYKIAIEQIQNNEKIKAETGGITGFGSVPGGHISMANGSGEANFEIKVMGEKQDVVVHVEMVKEVGEEWEIVTLE